MKKQKVVICDLDHTYLMTYPYIPHSALDDVCWIKYHKNAKIKYFSDITDKIQQYYDDGVAIIFLTAREFNLEFENITRKNIEDKFKGEYRLIMKIDTQEPDAVFKYKAVSRIKIYSEILEFLDDKECVCEEIRKLDIPVTHVVHDIPEKEQDMRMKTELEKMKIQEDLEFCCKVLEKSDSLLVATLSCSFASPNLARRLDLLKELITHIQNNYQWEDSHIKLYLDDTRIEFNDGEDVSIYGYICAYDNIDQIVKHLEQFNEEIENSLEQEGKDSPDLTISLENTGPLTVNGDYRAHTLENNEKDEINKPAHYTHSDVEPIDIIEAWKLPFHLGNVVKYIARHEHKGNSLKDLKKARWYLDRYIKLLERSKND